MKGNSCPSFLPWKRTEGATAPPGPSPSVGIPELGGAETISTLEIDLFWVAVRFSKTASLHPYDISYVLMDHFQM